MVRMTGNGDEAVGPLTSSPLVDGMARLEGEERLDRWVSSLSRPARLVGNGRLRWMLSGKWLGHALHPLLTDFPLGCWIGSGLLDLVGGRRSRPAAQQLAGLGVLFTVPTAAAGLSDWAVTKSDRARRVGVVHAALNGVVATCYLLSWRLRRRDHHRSGVTLAFAGGSLAWVSGYLGGHMSLRQQVGTGEPAVPIAVPAR
jgi:uncharacterized membrane protein